jgi:agmatine deiminase
VSATQRTPREEGFRWPAEWEPHRATWLAWPHNRETWPGSHLAAAEEAYLEMVRALDGRERIHILVVDGAAGERVEGLLARIGLGRGAALHAIATDDAWIRDHGPIFLEGPAGERALVDFRFDSWGGKYPPFGRDDAVPRAVAAELGVRSFEADFVLEGGSIDGNGEGTLLTTESCLLHPNREPGRSREQMEARLADFLGIRQVLWLGDGIEGDDTDGHVDDIARFVDATTVVAAREPDASDPNHGPLEANLRRLRAMADARGRRLAVATLPMPPPLLVDGQRRPASYANFYLANGCALVPAFGAPSDARALAVLRELLPGREVVPIPARALVVGLGAVHCLTQQEPGRAGDSAKRASAPRG